MAKADVNKFSLRMESVWIDAESRIIQDIARRIKAAGEISSTADYQINRLVAMGKSTEEVERILQEAIGATQPEIYKLYDEVLNQQYVRNRSIYEQINGMFIPPEDNEWLKELSEAVKSQTADDLHNIAQSYGFTVMIGNKRVFTPFSQYYQQYVDTAIVDVISGGFDYNTVLKRAVTQMTNSGLRVVDYASGRSNRADVAVRRAIMAGVAQINGKISEQTAQLIGTDYYEVDWHVGARPEHSVWQGRVYSYQQLIDICGLGSVTGLHGANCYHDYYPFVPGVSVRNYSDEWLDEQNEKEAQTKEWQGKEYNAYEQRQKQRQMETAMRAQREKVDALKAGGVDKDEIVLAQCKYQGQLNEYTRFCNTMGLDQQRERIYFDGRGRLAPSVDTQRMIEKMLAKEYNKNSILENIKLKERDIRLSKYIKSDKVVKTIKSGRQGKHIRGHNNYSTGNSYLTITEKEAQALVNKYAGTGKLKRDSKDKWTKKEFVIADQYIGVVVDAVTGEEIKTKRFSIHYSKKGTHIVPRKEN